MISRIVVQYEDDSEMELTGQDAEEFMIMIQRVFDLIKRPELLTNFTWRIGKAERLLIYKNKTNERRIS